MIVLVGNLMHMGEMRAYQDHRKQESISDSGSPKTVLTQQIIKQLIIHGG